jgi:hypothetical protein
MSLKDVLRGELGAWRGLPATETIESLTAQLQPLERVVQPEVRPRTYRRFLCSVFERPIAPSPIEAWVVYGERRVALVEYDDPPALALDDTLREYGAPDIIVSDVRFAADAMVREHIYARRGITFSVADPFEATTKLERRLVHLQLFPATTLESYLTDIGVSDAARPKTNPELGPVPQFKNHINTI